MDDVDELPSSASDVPLSLRGCLYLLAARISSRALFDSYNEQVEVKIFPSHANMIRRLLQDEGSSSTISDSYPEAFVDSILLLGLSALFDANVGDIEDDTVFNEYLQVMLFFLERAI